MLRILSTAGLILELVWGTASYAAESALFGTVALAGALLTAAAHIAQHMLPAED